MGQSRFITVCVQFVFGLFRFASTFERQQPIRMRFACMRLTWLSQQQQYSHIQHTKQRLHVLDQGTTRTVFLFLCRCHSGFYVVSHMCHILTMPMRALKIYSPNSTERGWAIVNFLQSTISRTEHYRRKHWLVYTAYVLLRQGKFHSKILTANLQTAAASSVLCAICMGTRFESHSPWDFHNSFSLAFAAPQQKHPLLHINAFAWIFSFSIDT